MSAFDGMAEIITGALAPTDPIYIVRPGEDREEVAGVFVSDYRAADAGDFGVVDGKRSAVTIETARTAGLEPPSGRVEYKGVEYKVVSMQDDSNGLTRLVLKRAGLAPAAA